MSSHTPVTPPGWYDDGHGDLRWWDGATWTEHTAANHPSRMQPQPAPAPVQQPVQPNPYAASTQVLPPRSKLPWILAIVFVLAALIGGVAGWAVGRTADPQPLVDSYRAMRAAEAAGDCAAFKQVTTEEFRDSLTPGDSFSCESWAMANGISATGDVEFAVRLGPVGLLAVEDSSIGLNDSLTLYTFVHEDGRWRVQGSDNAYNE